MDANGRREEVGIEAELKIISRCCVIRGVSGGFWMLTSLVRDHIGRDANNNGVLKCFSDSGYRYHVRGYCSDEPQQNAIRASGTSKAGKYIVVEVRKDK
jgi:hypothetical protein